jgi:hypothetical protein
MSAIGNWSKLGLRLLFLVGAFVAVCDPSNLAVAQSKLALTVVDHQSGEPAPARIYVTDEAGQAYFLYSGEGSETAIVYDKTNWINKNSSEQYTSVVDYPCFCQLPRGRYTVLVERGKSFLPLSRTIEIGDEDVTLTLALKRWIDPARRGWYSGDLHIHRTIDQLRTVMLAEDLNVTSPLTYWVTRSDTAPTSGDRNSIDTLADNLIMIDPTHVIWPRNTEYEIFTTNGQQHTLGALIALRHGRPLTSKVPPWSPMIEEARQANPDVLFDMDKLDWPFAMVLPTLVPDAMYEIANNHMWRTEFAFRKWNTRAPTSMFLPDGRGEGGERDWIDYTLGMYYVLLNAGFQLAPAAGTANGVHPVPAGFGRVYAHLDGEFNFDRWCAALKQGQSFVTTGPMIFATAADQHPGHKFEFSTTRDPRPQLQISGEIISANPLTYAEIIVNGVPELLIRPQNERTVEGGFRTSIQALIDVSRSGWCAVRCFEQPAAGRTRFAHTAPWYVTVDQQPIRIPAAQREYLVQRITDEIKRSDGVVSQTAMREYQQALAYYRQLPILDDEATVASMSRPIESGDRGEAWLRNMVVDHHYTADEVRLATGMTRERAVAVVDSAMQVKPESADRTKLKVLPYPGGRHPRRGFLEGAVAPQRDTKVSVFPPWEDGGYVVIDLPEAIFSNLGLTYLAHTHIPTIWDHQQIDLEPVEWQVAADSLEMTRRLPNGIRFTSVITPHQRRVEMTITLTNGTPETLTGLRTQVCAMLSAADGFHLQTGLSNVAQEPSIAIKSADGDRWIITSWQPNHRVWVNPPVPCIHSDPIFPDCAPGETVAVNGTMWFYEGTDVQKFIDSVSQDHKR